MGWTGGALREDKGSVLRAGSERVLAVLGLASEHWVETIRSFQRRFFVMIGHVHRIDAHWKRTGRRHAKGSAWAARLYRSAA